MVHISNIPGKILWSTQCPNWIGSTQKWTCQRLHKVLAIALVHACNKLVKLAWSLSRLVHACNKLIKACACLQESMSRLANAYSKHVKLTRSLSRLVHACNKLVKACTCLQPSMSRLANAYSKHVKLTRSLSKLVYGCSKHVKAYQSLCMLATSLHMAEASMNMLAHAWCLLQAYLSLWKLFLQYSSGNTCIISEYSNPCYSSIQ